MKKDLVRDPVCGTEFSRDQAATTAEWRGRTYYFWCQATRESFESEPRRFVRHEGEEDQMSTDVDNTRCPHGGTETGIERGTPAAIPVGLSLTEFETLVRNEWRRRLGPEAYNRARSGKIIRDLINLLAESGEELTLDRISDSLDRLITDLCAEGKGRRAFHHEFAKLRHAVRAVLRQAGAGFVTASDYVGRVRDVLDEATDQLSPIDLPEAVGLVKEIR